MSDEYLNSAYMEAGLEFNILGVDWRQMEGDAKTQVSSCPNKKTKTKTKTMTTTITTISWGSTGGRWRAMLKLRFLEADIS